MVKVPFHTITPSGLEIRWVNIKVYNQSTKHFWVLNKICFCVQFQEDNIYRHLEPALAFQLELNRMRSFNLKPITCTNKSLHLYYGSAKKVCHAENFFQQ